MLVYDFIHVPLPVTSVRQRLLVAMSGLWQQVAAAAYDEGEELLSRVGPFGPVPGLSKAVSVHVGEIRDRGEGFVMPLQWSATGPTELFPVMQADLEIAPLGAQQTQLRLSGSYDPPLGAFGRRMDRMLLHQLAEATVRALLKQLVAALLAESATGPGTPTTPPQPDLLPTSTTDTPTAGDPNGDMAGDPNARG